MPAIDLDQRDRERLIKLLGMIGSSADGEALNAARLANKLVQDRGLTWAAVLNGKAIPQPQTTWTWTPPRPPPPPPQPSGLRWRTIAEFILEYKIDFINEWEEHFLESILHRTYDLSDKQRATLVKIGEKCGIIVD